MIRPSFTLSLLLAVATVLPAWSQAPIPTNKNIAVTDVKPEFVESPSFSSGYSKKTSGKPGRWIEIEVDFARAEKIVPRLSNDVTMKVFVLLKNGGIPRFDDPKDARNNFPDMLTGTAALEYVPDQKGLKYAFFIPPQVINAAFPGNPPVTMQQTIFDIGVTIESAAGKAIYSWKGSVDVAKFQGWWDNTAQVNVIANGVLPKSKTPFAHLVTDYFQVEKQSN